MPIPTFAWTWRWPSREWSPRDLPYVHTLEGPDDMPAHVKSSLFGASVTVPIPTGRPCFGTWQGIYLCEHRDRAGGRSLVLTAFGQSDSERA